MQSETFNVRCETASAERTLLLCEHPTADLDQQIDDWFVERGIACVYSIAELANPLRANGKPVLTVALDLPDGPELERLVAEFGLIRVQDSADLRRDVGTL